MWIVAPLERNDKGKLQFVDHAAIDLYQGEAKAREAVRDGLRSGDPFVGLFKVEGVYDAEVSVKKIEES